MRGFVTIGLGALLAAGQVWAQEPALPGGGPDATRVELEALLAQLEGDAGAGGKAARAQRIRTRLTEGDFRVGDPILLSIEGEGTGADTLLVSAGPVLVVPEIGAIPLAGVLRSELEAHLTTELGRYYREPVVHARPLVMLSVAGEVARPGFYMMTDRERLSEALMLAGGPTREADMEEVRIERADGTVIASERVRAAIADAGTVGHLDLRSGDRIVVPERSGITRGEVFRALLLAVPAAVLGLIQVL